jgi:hypothetical protein
VNVKKKKQKTRDGASQAGLGENLTGSFIGAWNRILEHKNDPSRSQPVRELIDPIPG